ncbi:hypothetical protein RFI_10834 [Reticulomyxa filosa]|uniref:Uncharacterized protein n=1 Tax=Reticulomyxa filosa TaxID=46433 RepID=X6NKN8_RETFI|nr:hypothetical protein RFI_10834 [Reticulomyxa filosa]|eukprot:ETO26299.1 hypothetical protein RFI_10834 [Reticulomyxa filosa]
MLGSYLNTFSKRYDFMVPKDKHIALQMDSRARALLGDIWNGQWQYIVGLAWRDSLVSTVLLCVGHGIGSTIVLWIVALVLVTLNVLSEYWWRKWLFLWNKKIKGGVWAAYELFENWWDPHHVLDENQQEKENANKVANSFWTDYIHCLAELILASLQVAGGLAVVNATQKTILNIYGGKFVLGRSWKSNKKKQLASAAKRVRKALFTVLSTQLAAQRPWLENLKGQVVEYEDDIEDSFHGCFKRLCKVSKTDVNPNNHDIEKH